MLYKVPINASRTRNRCEALTNVFLGAAVVSKLRRACCRDNPDRWDMTPASQLDLTNPLEWRCWVTTPDRPRVVSAIAA